MAKSEKDKILWSLIENDIWTLDHFLYDFDHPIFNYKSLQGALEGSPLELTKISGSMSDAKAYVSIFIDDNRARVIDVDERYCERANYLKRLGLNTDVLCFGCDGNRCDAQEILLQIVGKSSERFLL